MSKFDRVMAVIWVIGFFGFGPFLIYQMFDWDCIIGVVGIFLILLLLSYVGDKFQKGPIGSIGNESWGSGWSDGSYSWDGGDGGGGDGGGGDCGGGGWDCGDGE